MWGPSHTFSDHNVQELTMNSALQLYAVLLLLSDLRYSFQNSEASLYRPENVALQQVDFLRDATGHKEALTSQKMRRCCPTFSGLWDLFVCGPAGPYWLNMLNLPWTCLNPPLDQTGSNQVHLKNEWQHKCWIKQLTIIGLQLNRWQYKISNTTESKVT